MLEPETQDLTAAVQRCEHQNYSLFIAVGLKEGSVLKCNSCALTAPLAGVVDVERLRVFV